MASPDSVPNFGPFRIDLGNQLLYREGVEVPLPPRAMAVLLYLAGRPNQVVTKRELMDAVWKDAFVEDASIKEAVSLVRQALADDSQQPQFIQTLHRRGYRFVAPPTPAIPGSPPVKVLARVRAVPLWAAGALALCAAVGGAAVTERWMSRRGPSRPEIVRFTIGLVPGTQLPSSPMRSVAVAPDGSAIAWVAMRGETTALYVRRLDQVSATLVSGTDDARSPFFSPDGRWLGFLTSSRLRKVALSGGAPIDLCDVRSASGASWTDDGTIVYGSEAGLRAIAADGGSVAELTTADRSRGQIGHWWPEALPGGEHVLFTIWTTALERAQVAIMSRRTRQVRVLMDGASDAHYVAPDALIVQRSGGLARVAFSVGRLQIAGPVSPIVTSIAADPFSGVTQVAISRNGSVAAIEGTQAALEAKIVTVGRGGDLRSTSLPVRPYRNARLSPDGHRLAVTINEPSSYDVWIADLARGTLTRLTSAGRNIEPIWSPDGQWVTYASTAFGPFGLTRQRSDGSGVVERPLVRPSGGQYPWSYSPDGRLLAFDQFADTTGDDLWVLSFENHQARPFLTSTRDEAHAAFSPDGHWIAYDSDESGTDEVYVRPYPGPGGKWQVSVGGGDRPLWDVDGRQLFYQSSSRFVAVRVALGLSPQISQPVVLFDRNGLECRGILPDGRFVAIESERDQSSPTYVTVMLNGTDSWTSRDNE
jgi:Tol biopolymer transport system component/DNA-binding winged helix-turn-helix (wHTH) protein